jgi:hypothetical protein
MREQKADFLDSSGGGVPSNDGRSRIDEATADAIDHYGSNARTAVAWRALNAHFDGNAPDYQFWCKVFGRLPVSAEPDLRT